MRTTRTDDARENAVSRETTFDRARRAPGVSIRTRTELSASFLSLGRQGAPSEGVVGRAPVPAAQAKTGAGGFAGVGLDRAHADPEAASDLGDLPQPAAASSNTSRSREVSVS